MNNSPLAPVLRATPQAPDRNVMVTPSGRRLLLLTAATLACLGTQGFASWVQPNIPGAVDGVTKYRILFAMRDTSWNKTAGSTIAPFNGLVQTAANSANAIAYGLPQYTDGTTDGHIDGDAKVALTWACLGCTVDGQSAVQNVTATLADWNNNNYVYNTLGVMVTDPTLQLFGSNHLAGAQYAEDGYANYDNNGGYRVATGGTYGSTAGTLGNAASVGRTNPIGTGSGNWFWQNNFGPGGCGLYALSGLMTWYNTTPALPSPGITLTTVEPLRLMLGTTGTIAGNITNSASATASYSNAQLSDASGQASNGLGMSGWNPAGAFTVDIGGNQAFTATLAAGWNLNGQGGGGFVKTYTVKVDDGAGSIASVSHTVDCLDNRHITADQFAAHAHAGFTSPVTLPVTLTGSGMQDNVTTMPTVAATTYTTDDTFVSVTGVAGTFSGGSTTHSVNVTLNPGATSGTLNLALADGVGANIVLPEGLVGESINGLNYCPSGTGNISVPSDHLDMNYTVYTGLGVWNTNGSGNWSDFSKWTADGGVPGIEGVLSVNDTATFGSVVNPGPATVNLDVSPRIKALTFDDTLGSYLLAGAGTLTLNNGGGGVTITASAGSHTISANIDSQASSDACFFNGAGKVTLSGTNVIGKPGQHWVTGWGVGGNLEITDGTTTVAQPVPGGGDTDTANNGGIGGTMTVSGGSFIAGGHDIGLGGTLTVKGTGSFILNNGGVYDIGGGTLNIQDSGTFTVDRGVLNNSWTVGGINTGMGWGTTPPTTVNQDGGTVNLPYFQPWTTGNGPGLCYGPVVPNSNAVQTTYNLNGGVLNVSAIMCILTPDWGPPLLPCETVAGSSAIFNFNGGTLKATQDDSSDTGAITEGSNHLMTNLSHAYVGEFGAKIDTNNHACSINQPLEHSPSAPATDGGLTKLGLGTLTLLQDCTYTGPTKVEAGTLACATSTALAATALEIDALATVALDYAGTRNIPSLKIGGMLQPNGVYGNSNPRSWAVPITTPGPVASPASSTRTRPTILTATG
ncbi:MAG: autotransporter-associated beta strand repeat-containing protein [Verrucomicrobia bacterium]|nr:autotransporter-associated beta strand repeat-containing protein [Verrucomicrobiota bacterium]